MNNLKKFLGNKNTITLIGIILIVAILYFGYRWQVDRAIKPVNVPYALTTIQPSTRITDDMVGTMQVPPVYINSGDVIQNANEIIGKYANFNTLIPQGSLFFRDSVISVEDLPDAPFYSIPKGMVAYNMPVNMEKSYANSIFPGNFIDVFFKAVDADGKIIFGKLASNVEVLAVKDGSGRNVFENSAEGRTPAVFILSVPEEMHLLLRKAWFLNDIDSDLIPVPIGDAYKPEEGSTELSSDYLAEYINARALYVPQNVAPTDTDDTSNTDDDTTNNNDNSMFGE